ncbi:MAG: outer membrane beta-barrel protein [Prevotella sp.]|nr:outer membrane beta-barrel protein [Prevotella sp.]
MNELSQVFYKSNETVEKFWKTNYDKNSLTRLTRQYSEQYCKEYGDCVQYMYDEKKTACFKVRLYVGAGMKVGTIQPKYIYLPRNHDFSLSAFSPNISVGLDILFPRLSKHLIAQACLDLGYMKATKDTHQLTGCPLQTQWGLAYKFNPERKVSPLIRGGITFNHLIGASGKNMETISGNEKKFQDIDFGFYLGVGTDIALDKYTLRFSANYEYSSSLGLFEDMDQESLRTSAIAVRAGILF